MTKFKDYNEIDILYTLMSYVNVSSSQDMYYTIAHTILTNLEKIPDININDLADLCYTSPATISRFCKDLNCKSFANFKHEMALALEATKEEICLSEPEQEKIQKQPQYLVDKIYQETIDSLHMGQLNINIHDIDRICHMIHHAKKIYMIGYQFNRIVSNDFQLKMIKLKKFVYSFVERGDEIQRLDMIDEDTLVIILTVRARPRLIEPLLAKIKEHHPQILLITMNKEYKNDDIDCVYCIDGTESQYTQSSMQGTINILTLLNLIYVRYAVLYKK
jgi:RpiR family carbohydrate utilization transcriptional regulator